ncbi:unnamed protein product [Caenorhabditis angaria]|uniref:Uncharacterized protein n=1 Tax=Caenorhabditis angaria TaxID=860376 RepID=A0A9P1IVE7_9PELO|nr:unnamed protein product [Caenorhabditis angaria]
MSKFQASEQEDVSFGQDIQRDQQLLTERASQMYFWLPIHFMVTLLGVSTLLLYFRIVVCTKILDVYCRFSLFLMSFGKLLVLISYSGILGLCTFYDLESESEECSEYPLHTFFAVLHSMGEYLNVGPFFVLVLDRLFSILNINHHNSESYSQFYTVLMSSNIFLIFIYVYAIVMASAKIFTLAAIIIIFFVFFISLGLVVYLFHISENIYYSTQGKLSLDKRFRLSQSHELSKSLLPPVIFGCIVKLILIFSIFLVYAEIVQFSNPDTFYQIWNLCLNIDCIILPIMFLYLHKAFRKKIRSMLMISGRGKVQRYSNIEWNENGCVTKSDTIF